MAYMATDSSTGGQHDHKKHVIFMIIALTIALAIAGCGNDNAETTTKTTTTMKPGGIKLDALNFSGGPRLAITASPVSPDGTNLPMQRLLLDTGSSTLAFCNTTLANVVRPLKANFISCNVYGSEETHEGFWGYFYQGAVDIADGAIQVSNASYSIMQQQVSMPCDEGMGGIFGIAFRQLDEAAPSKHLPHWPEDGVGITCPQSKTDFVEPLMQYLNSRGGVEQIGIFWSGKLGPGEGQLYLDDDATNNPYYVESKAIGKAKLGEFGWYDIDVQSVEYNGFTDTEIMCQPKEGQPCIMDTGTPVLVIPEVIFLMLSEKKSGSITVNLSGQKDSDSPVSLKFDVKILLDNDWVAPTRTPGVILGLPLRAFYYTVVDITDYSVEFVPMAAHLKQELGLPVDGSEARLVV